MNETVVSTAANVTNINFLNTIIDFFEKGGLFMGIILLVWGIGIAICLERYSKLKKMDINGPGFMNEIQRHILSNDLQGAIRICSGSQAVLPRVLKSGLKRSSSSTEQMQNAIDATALEVIPKVESRLNYLSLIANISTLFGLLGTIQGLITSFAAVAAADPSQKAEMLANGIAKAMNTTFLGLLSAITIMILHSFLVAKAESIINGIDEYSVKLIDLLGTKSSK
jgi:biopolymer transport protein ExbB